MKKNIGKTDQIIRIALAILLIILYFLGVVSGLLSYLLLVVAFILVATSSFKVCPLYTFLGFNSCPHNNK